MKIRFESVRLNLKESFAIAHGRYEYRDSMIIGIEENGYTGWGEAVAIDYYGYSIDDLLESARTLGSYWEDHPFPGVRPFYIENRKRLGENTFVLSAFDCAAHDLAAKKEEVPWRQWMGWSVHSDIPPSSRTIGFGSLVSMRDDIRRWSKWPSLKLKLGPGAEVDMLEALLQESGVPLRVDANGSWSIEQVEQAMALDVNLPLELIEQPLSPDEDDRLEELIERRIPIIADESFRKRKDLDRYYERYDGVNMKLLKCGGLTPAVELIKEAKQKGYSVMIGCMTESSIGITAAAQIASWCDYVDLDGALLIDNDPAHGADMNNGFIRLPMKPGLGIGMK